MNQFFQIHLNNNPFNIDLWGYFLLHIKFPYVNESQLSLDDLLSYKYDTGF